MNALRGYPIQFSAYCVYIFSSHLVSTIFYFFLYVFFLMESTLELLRATWYLIFVCV